MEENTNEILGIQETIKVDNTNAYNHEKTLKTIAIIVLVVGIIATLIMLFTVTFPETLKDGYSYTTERNFSFTGLLTTILTCVSAVTTWAVLNVLSNISINLFKIKDSFETK